MTYRKLPRVEEDFRSLMLGDILGEGVSRTTYAHAVWPQDFVVKVQTGSPFYFQNIIEFNTWTMAKQTPGLCDWLAPIVAISELGRVIIMRRAHPLRPEERPLKVPGFLADLKTENWGMLDGRPVAVDYGWAPRIEGTHAKLRKAVWDYEPTE